MKRYLIFLLLPLFFANTDLSAQTSLEFNQVVAFDMTHSTDYSFTVPAGKVWKVVSAGSSYTGGTIKIRNSSSQDIYIIYSGVSTARSMTPLWLPSSWSGAFRYFDSGSDRALVTVLEFNVVP